MSEREEPAFGEEPQSEEGLPAMVHATWFLTTGHRLKRLGMTQPGPDRWHLEYTVSADGEQFAFSRRRLNEPFMTIPTGKVRSIWLGMTRASFLERWRYDPVFAIVLNVEASEGLVAVPIMPTGDNWWTRLTWTYRDTHLAAERLSHASGVPLRP